MLPPLFKNGDLVRLISLPQHNADKSLLDEQFSVHASSVAYFPQDRYVYIIKTKTGITLSVFEHRLTPFVHDIKIRLIRRPQCNHVLK